MRINRAFCAILTLLLICTLCSCGETDYTDKNITYRTADDVSTLDPQLASTGAEFSAAVNCFEGIMTLSEDGSLTTGAVDKYDVSEDGLNYTFTLRSGMLWSDGETKVTADDYIYGLTRALLPETKAPFASLLYSIKNAKAVNSGKISASELGLAATGELTFTITLEKPDRNLLRTLANPVSMPCNRAFFDSTNGKYGLDSDSIMGNGAYYLKMWNTEDNYLALRRFDDYNGVQAIPYSITLGFNRELTDIHEALVNDEINIGVLDGDFASRLDESKYGRQLFYNTSYVLLLSPKVPSKLRRALVTDVNIAAMQMNLPSYYDIIGGIIPSSSKEGTKAYRDTVGVLTLHSYDAAKAKTLIAEAADRYDDGIDYAKYTLYYPSGDSDVKKCAGMLAQTWQNDLNAFINTQEYTGSDYIEKLKSGDMMAAVVPVSSVTGSAYDAANSLAALGISGYNKLLPSAGDDTEISCDALEQAEQYLVDNYYAVPLFCEPMFICMSSNIGGAVFSTSGNISFFKYIKKED